MKFLNTWMYFSMCTCLSNSNQLISAGEPFEVNELSLIVLTSIKLYLHAINFSTLTTQAGDTFSNVCCSTCSGGFKNETVVVVRASTTLEIASMEYFSWPNFAGKGVMLPLPLPWSASVHLGQLLHSWSYWSDSYAQSALLIREQ